MAKQTKTTTSVITLSKTKKKRPDVHSKKKNSRGKKSKNYRKTYRGQGR
jgi:hypothetical protein